MDASNVRNICFHNTDRGFGMDAAICANWFSGDKEGSLKSVEVIAQARAGFIKDENKWGEIDSINSIKLTNAYYGFKAEPAPGDKLTRKGKTVSAYWFQPKPANVIAT